MASFKKPGLLAMNFDNSASLDGSCSASYDFDISNTGTIRMMRESCGELSVNSKGIQIKPSRSNLDKVAGEDRHEVHYKVSADDICEFQVIGSGISSQVKKGVDLRNNRFVALKVMSVLDKELRQNIMNEVRTLCESEHAGSLVHFHGAFYTQDTQQITIVLEYMDAGSLATVIQKAGPLPEPVLAAIAQQVLHGLVFLHDVRRTMHRDIKPGNILLNNHGETKVSDFGITAGLENTMAVRFSYKGTMCYMSPERISNVAYTAPADVWSLGLTLYEAATGKYPYSTSQGPVHLCVEITEYPPPPLPSDKFSAELVDFVARCLDRDPGKRHTAAQLLAHPFLTSHLGSPLPTATSTGSSGPPTFHSAHSSTPSSQDSGQASPGPSPARATLAAFLQSLTNHDERLQNYSQLFAAHYYRLYDTGPEALPHLALLYQDESVVSMDGEMAEGRSNIVSLLERHSTRLGFPSSSSSEAGVSPQDPTGVAEGQELSPGAQGRERRRHRHRIETVDVQAYMNGQGMLAHLAGHLQILPNPESSGERPISIKYYECFILRANALGVAGDFFIANQVRQYCSTY